MQSMNAARQKKNKKKTNNKGKFHFTLRGIRFGGCLFLFCILSCVADDSYPKINEIKPLLKSGDIIFRNGTDEVSEAARSFNRTDKRYSHCGIVQRENDTLFVYHALGGPYNPSQKLMKQLLDDFCNEKDTDRIGIYRYTLSEADTKQLDSLLKKQYSAGLPFDLFFNFYTDDRMYCSEFVFKSLNTATQGALNNLLHREEPIYISIDDLYVNTLAEPVAEIIF